VLQRFVNEHFSGLTLAEMEQLDALLELPDNVFWDLIQGVNPKAEMAPSGVILEKLRASRPTAEQETA
jgi:antitoxin CptB